MKGGRQAIVLFPFQALEHRDPALIVELASIASRGDGTLGSSRHGLVTELISDEID
ncbi:hypothetical protein O3S81_20455 [Agrobacterium sp. SOY23]|uniref:hypothetical protein n=1 Tax=Agrobacterium sp. SOY23 TaxID=3014555 RepID=UPI0022AFC4C6|nr:hypothetical protein [Agrobacterium sp. SOY23]MCZ4432086.1 hypothetical protein [Agrobacterium sp. SOY23]